MSEPHIAMSIETAAGSSVIYMGANGYDYDKHYANARLTVGTEYVVESMTVGRSSSSVKLVGIEGSFNNVMFMNATTDYEKYDWYSDSYPSWEKIQGWVAEAKAVSD